MTMIMRWTPFNELARVQAEMNRLFDGSLGTTPASPRDPGEELMRGVWHPAVDVTEDPEKIVLQADLPGVSQKELEIQIDKDVLTLRGERKLERKTDKDGYHRFERVTGTFVRSFSLPPTVDVEKIAAAVKDGVLTLTLPKRPEAQPRQIKVKVEG
jgi:HSP20 family protein